MMVEKLGRSVTQTSMVSIAVSYAIEGMVYNTSPNPNYWKPSTFGGQFSFDIVKSVSVKNLFCNNMKPGECQNIGFYLPKEKAKSKTEL